MRPTPETERIKGALHTNWDDLLNHARKLERERDEAREELVWVTRLVETIRDKAEIRYGRNTGFMAFSDLKDEARRSMRLEAAK